MPRLWTNEDHKKIVKMNKAGKSMAEIANYFKVTRNTICGKLHRMKLSRGKKTVNAPTVFRVNKKTKPQKKQFIPEKVYFPEKVYSLEEINPSCQCMFPYGDPKEPGFGFCGLPINTPPYCDHHRSIAYNKK